MSNYLGSETIRGRNDERALKSDDSSWLHAYPFDNNRQKTQCKYYDKKITSGGITRLK